ncbi:GNAT family N-acetyltransferase [Streptosporangium sp. NBC_01756]|uniref:GNAT family N-acetyltransferase n=1 Tax=Streptosporangium sp. NBC_01756 TaxID=2975950 RepID=UPI002DDC34BF|nr:GNAT family N-acetyltransferase [Streptosporangium sp. NBC_01756]WSC90486.1 GNAT family N-acetyltransferase [Streptosporangium sp. NBC_01756]
MEITAGKLHLRPWRPADAEAVAQALRDPEIRRWATRTPEEPDERTWIADRAAGWADGSSASFAITDTTGGEVLGHVRVRTRGDGIGEIGYWILAGARGRGVAGHAVGAVARWAFARLDLSRLDLRHAADNPASCRVAQKSGFALARLLTEPSWDGGGETVEVHLHMLSHA